MVKARFPRFVADRVEAAFADTPVVAVVGARQTGKSTLVREQVTLPRDAVYVTFDDPVPLATARADPDAFIDGYDVPLVLDEAQRVPEIFRAIKRAVDHRRRPGRYLLTGSADILHLPRISESLAGRMEIVTLWPLSQGEIAGRRETFIDRAFGEASLAAPEGETLGALLRRVARGGFPEAVERDAERRAAWFESYVAGVLQREITDIAAIERVGELPRLVRLLAARAGTVLNVADLGREAGISHTTLTRYLSMLDLAYLTVRMPSWSGNVGRRLIRHPKVLFVDTGLAAQLIGTDAVGLSRDGRVRGALVETFVAMELRKQLGWSATRAVLHHFRNASGTEVDVVLERSDGSLVAIEIKASATIESRDANGLRSFAETAHRRFHRGVLLYLGRERVALGGRIQAIPMSAIWSA